MMFELNQKKFKKCEKKIFTLFWKKIFYFSKKANFYLQNRGFALHKI